MLRLVQRATNSGILLIFSTIFHYFSSIQITIVYAAVAIPIDQKHYDALTINQLDDYSLLDIFDFLSIAELASVAQLSPRYYNLIMEHLVPKYGLNGAKVYISLAEWGQYTHMQYTRSSKNSAAIKLSSGHRETFEVLKIFCHLFTRVSIKLSYQFRFNYELTETLAHHVNNYCPANAPQNINVYAVRNSGLNFTFEHMTNVRIQHLDFWERVKLNNVFPQMDSLMLGASSKVTIKEHFTNLKSFELYEFECGLFDWKAFAEKNPEIRRIKLDLNWETECLHQVTDLLPKLETLNVNMKSSSAARRPRYPKGIVSRLMEVANLNVISVIVDDAVREMLMEFAVLSRQWILTEGEKNVDEMIFKRRKVN